MKTALALRAMAIAIAIAGVIDPAVHSPWAPAGTVAVVDTGDAQLTRAVRDALEGSFTVHDGPIAGAQATILAGDAMPPDPPAVSGVLIGVTPSTRRPRLEIVSIDAPVGTPSTRVPVRAQIRATALKGTEITVTLSLGGLLLDRRTHNVTADTEMVPVSLEIPAPAAGAAAAEVRVTAGALRASGAVTIDTRDTRWRVLVFDARPSWASTFVRRALEADRRFDVVSRVATSRTVAAESGPAPALTAASDLDAFDAVVLGAPDALDAREVDALERYARQRGGSVVLLLDRPERGALSGLLDGLAWRAERAADRRRLDTASGALSASELALLQGPSADVVALATSRSGDVVTPVVWEAPVGAGRVIVNGALDAWQSRGRDSNGFARFWVDAVGRAAAASLPALSVDVPSAARPDTDVVVGAAVRAAQLSDPALRSPETTISARLGGANGTVVRLWPTPERGVFSGVLRTPSTPGTYVLSVEERTAGGVASRSTPLTVAGAGRVAVSRTAAAWVQSRGGTLLSEDGLSRLSDAVRQASRAGFRPDAAHPMRSPWWIPVFVAVVGAEWWIRRWRGER